MRLFRDVRAASSSVILGLLLSSVRSVLLLRILPPALLGAWKTAFLVDGAGEFARLGINRGVEVQVPVLTVQGKQREATAFEDTAATFSLILGLLYGVMVAAAGFLVANRDLRIALWTVAPLMAVAQPYFFLRDLSTTRQNFALRNRETLWRSGGDAVLVVVGVMAFGLAGMGLAATAVTIAATIYLIAKLPFRFRLRFHAAHFRALVRIGFPYSLTEAAFELLRRLDVICIAIVLGPVAVGTYGISLLVMDLSTVVARKGVAQVVSPHLMREFGRTGSHRAVAQFYEAPARLFAYLLPPALALGAFVIGDLVRMAMPQYTAGIKAAEITVWAVFFVALHASLSSFFVAADRIPKVLRFFRLLIPLAAVAQFVGLRAGFGIEGAAWTTVGTLALLSVGELVLARASCGADARAIVRFIATLTMPLAIAITLHAGVGALAGEWLLPAPLRLAVAMVLFLVLYSPVFFLYENRFSLLRAVRHAT